MFMSTSDKQKMNVIAVLWYFPAILESVFYAAFCGFITSDMSIWL